MKCQQCRDKDIELLTKWERFKNWLFYKLFPEDIADLSQNKYTQGFSDGWTAGAKNREQVSPETLERRAKEYTEALKNEIK